MIVYKYDERGYFMGPRTCQEDPLMGGYLYPEYGTYTTIEPAILLNMMPQWNGSCWNQIPDHRGLWYSTINGSAVYIQDIDGDITTLTRLEKPGPFYEWIRGQWIENQVKKDYDETLLQLRSLDIVMSRALEDLLDVLLSKNVLKKGELSQSIQNIYDLKKALEGKLES